MRELYKPKPDAEICHAHAISETIDKVTEFAAEYEVQWLLGGHVEMKTSSGKTFQSQSHARRGERVLELPVSILIDIQSALSAMAEQPVVKEYDEFVLLPHPADPRGKQPPNWCLTDD